MGKPMARKVLRATLRAGHELEALPGPLRKQCTATEYRTYARGVAQAIDGISTALTNKVLAAHPDLADEIESNLKCSDRAI
jgi:hypothetical protein